MSSGTRMVYGCDNPLCDNTSEVVLIVHKTAKYKMGCNECGDHMVLRDKEEDAGYDNILQWFANKAFPQYKGKLVVVGSRRTSGDFLSDKGMFLTPRDHGKRSRMANLSEWHSSWYE